MFTCKSTDPKSMIQTRGVLCYIRHKYVCATLKGRAFVLKTIINFAHFGLELCMVFQGTAGVHERIYRFNSK